MGSSIGKYLKEHAVEVSGYYSRTKSSAVWAAGFTESKSYADMGELIADSDVVCISTNDGAIGEVWNLVRKYNLSNKIISHFSGSLSIDVFSNWEQTGCEVCSIHPMFAFSDKESAYQQLNHVMFTMEGSKSALLAMKALFESFGNSVVVIPGEKKMLYHAAASLMSNHLMGLLKTSVDMLKESGFEEEQAYRLLEPLATNNLRNAFANGAAAALTGPIERGDIDTVRKHLSCMNEEQKAVYRALGPQVVKLAIEKNVKTVQKQTDIAEGKAAHACAVSDRMDAYNEIENIINNNH
ncbi:MAG: DUF2520 domain-containing protein [Lachnospiraceae bacterium]|nr:DUF2520 domain-containing protein [Lachnospiraceae bacterium]